jgi:hypothetical protein
MQVWLTLKVTSLEMLDEMWWHIYLSKLCFDIGPTLYFELFKMRGNKLNLKMCKFFKLLLTTIAQMCKKRFFLRKNFKVEYEVTSAQHPKNEVNVNG